VLEDALTSWKVTVTELGKIDFGFSDNENLETEGIGSGRDCGDSLQNYHIDRRSLQIKERGGRERLVVTLIKIVNGISVVAQ
jgi:hypothetical protein